MKAVKSTKRRPADRVREHVATVTRNRASYEVQFDGTVDGVMTRSPIGYEAYHQGFQPNRSVCMENIGETDVVNPWLIVNGKRNWRTVEDIVAEATAGCRTERDKAIAIWEFEKHHRFHACTWDAECNDPVKVLNVYGYTLCGNDAHAISDLWRAAGLKVRRGFPIGHCTAEAFFDGRYHLLDGDEHIICLLRDNETIADEAEIVRDHDLMKRTHTYGILAAHDPIVDQGSASLHWYDGERQGEHRSHVGHTMHFTLRPGESIEWRWGHVGKQYTAGTMPKPGEPRRDGHGDLRRWGARAYAKLCNGKLRYTPDLRSPAAQRGVHSASNVMWQKNGDGVAVVRPARTQKTARIAWRIHSPYVIVGGKIELTVACKSEGDRVRVLYSRDGKRWRDVWAAAGTGHDRFEIVLDDRLSPRGKPQYAYFVRLDMTAADDPADVALHAISFDTDVQMSMLSLPELAVGANKVRYVDDSPDGRKVRVTHNWVERRREGPPNAPSAPAFPPDGATVEGTEFTFEWQPATDPRGEKIVDYHFQLGRRRDLRWTLSPNFDRLISLTPSKGKSEWAIPDVGLLNPDTTYHWRVRAKNAKGVWGPWSETWQFQCRAPGVPLNLTSKLDRKAGTVTIAWEPNPKGRRPARYKVYGSDEQGFTASDVPYKLETGRGFCTSLEEYERKTKAEGAFSGVVTQEANLVTETQEQGLVVVGPDAKLPNTNRAFYRVVAVDSKGNESGPSDYVAVPRPFTYTRPQKTAAVGRAYRYEPGCITAIGHLTCREGYNGAFWDRETVTWSLDRGPTWLSVDPATGLVSGAPRGADVGRHKVVLRAVNNAGREAVQRFVVTVGRERQ